jgi:hypothetical protein
MLILNKIMSLQGKILPLCEIYKKYICQQLLKKDLILALKIR